jgi:endo-1,3(4)-beta-glucanase
MGTNRIVPEPYHIKPVTQGLYICFPGRTVTASAITTAFLQNIAIEASETISTTKISGYDDLSVSYRWEVDSNNKMTSTFVQGSIFNTIEFVSLTPKITTQHAITSVNGDSTFPDTATGTKFKVVLNNGQTWIIYTESSITFDIQNSGGWRMLADAEYTGWIKMAYLTEAADEAALDTYKTIHPTGGTVSSSVVSNTATITYTFTTDGTGTLAMLALPHHLDLLSNTQSGVTYQTMKGVGTAVEGATWVMTEALTTITWDAPRVIESGKVAAIQTALDTNESYTSSTANDPYFGGKEYAKLGRLISLAENSQINDPTAATTLRASAKTALEPWLNGTNTNAIKYDTTWKGICTTDGLASSSNDFGAGYYNDHHFHWGYHILAAAYIARNDSSWLASYEDKVNVYVRDIMNPSASDTYFTKFRHFDWYHGHSWAAGLFNFGDPKNQESTSEAVMAYYGCMLWGIASGNDNIKEHARILLAMEIRSSQKYWHRYTGNDQYEAGMTGNGIGILWSSKVDDTTFFGGDIEYRRGIQIIPILPITEELISSAWASEFYPNEIAGTLGTIDQGWRNFMFAAQATYDKTAAQTNADTLTDYDGGNSKTNQLYWHATRP